MSAIAGIMTADGAPPAPDLLESLAAALAHRCLDGGRWQVREGVGLWQGLPADGGGAAERPLRGPEGALLVLDGRMPVPGDDAGGILAELAAGADGGPGVPARGGWAVAALEPAEGQLRLGRDGFGLRPLYYAEGPFGFAFASEPRALLRAGLVAPELAGEPLQELLQLQFTTGRETVWRRIARLLPGETLTVLAGRIVARAVRRAEAALEPPLTEEQPALAALDAALRDSFALHAAGGPAGLLLSGGVDSAVLLALWRDAGGPPPVVFAGGFAEGSGPDERPAAERLARQVGARVVEVGVGEADFWRLLPQIAAATDDPVADYALLLEWRLGQAARAEVAVVLTGEGGDELFAGYGRHRAALRPWWMGGPRALWPRGRFDRLGVLLREPTAWRDGIRALESVLAARPLDDLQRLQLLDEQSWLVGDLMVKLDRCTTAQGLDARAPLLDAAVARVAMRLSRELKIRRGVGKYLLRRWLEGVLPEARPFQPKEGQTAPVARWLAGRGEELGALVARQAGVAELARPDRVRALFRHPARREAMAAWTLLYFALWHRAHVEGADCSGGVFETLGG